jgi:hypothetical protein
MGQSYAAANNQDASKKLYNAMSLHQVTQAVWPRPLHPDAQLGLAIASPQLACCCTLTRKQLA